MCGISTGVVQSGLGWTVKQLQFLFERTRGGKMIKAPRDKAKKIIPATNTDGFLYADYQFL